MGMHKIEGKFEQLDLLQPLTMKYDQNAKDEFHRLKNEGKHIECPCCEKAFNVVYKRNLYKAQITALRELETKKGSFNPSSFGDFSKLQFWGLIYRLENNHWRITSKGSMFLHGLTDVSKYVFLQNNILIGSSDEKVRIDDFL